VTERAFYCAANERYFPGAVALVNSLRRAGHAEPIHLLDCGLEPAHRELLEQEVTVLPGETASPPYLLKTVAPLAHPAETMVLIDVDMVVLRSLAPVTDGLAAGGGVAAFRNRTDRFIAEWGELLDLGPLERRRYVSSGFVAVGGDRGRAVLELWDDRQRRVDFERSWHAGDDPGYEFRFIDQDVLNAVLCARVAGVDLTALDARLAPTPPFDGLRERGASRELAYADGARPYLLHHFEQKPWLTRVRSNHYSLLLSELLLDGRGPLRLDPAELPLRLRRGYAAALDRAATDVALIPRGALRRLRERGGRAP
jgi:hypothetical protein